MTDYKGIGRSGVRKGRGEKMNREKEIKWMSLIIIKIRIPYSFDKIISALRNN